MKMYILVKKSIPLWAAMTAVAHASAAAILRWNTDPATEAWLASFKKVICELSDEEFDVAKGFLDEMKGLVMTESGLGNQETAIVFRPIREYPKFFKYLKLYK